MVRVRFFFQRSIFKEKNDNRRVLSAVAGQSLTCIFKINLKIFYLFKITIFTYWVQHTQKL